MDKIQAWFADGKNLPIIAGGAGVIIILLIVGMWRTSANRRSAYAPDAKMQYSMPGMPGMPPGAPGMPGMPGGMPGMPGKLPMEGGPMGMPGAPGMMPPFGVTYPGDAVAAAPLVQPAAQSPLLPYRKDPFTSFQGKPTRKMVLDAYVPRQITPYRLAALPGAETVESEETEVLPPQPYRRMAGILINGKISALLETNGETDIVVPGSVVNRGDSRVRVESISEDELILKTLDTKTPMTIKVNLGGAVTQTTGGGLGVARPTGGGAITPIR